MDNDKSFIFAWTIPLSITAVWVLWHDHSIFSVKRQISCFWKFRILDYRAFLCKPSCWIRMSKPWTTFVTELSFMILSMPALFIKLLVHGFWWPGNTLTLIQCLPWMQSLWIKVSAQCKFQKRWKKIQFFIPCVPKSMRETLNEKF